jgi:hypothetical protein
MLRPNAAMSACRRYLGRDRNNSGRLQSHLPRHVVIVDFTGKNPNVMYKTGIAHTLGGTTAHWIGPDGAMSRWSGQPALHRPIHLYIRPKPVENSVVKRPCLLPSQINSWWRFHGRARSSFGPQSIVRRDSRFVVENQEMGIRRWSTDMTLEEQVGGRSKRKKDTIPKERKQGRSTSSRK